MKILTVIGARPQFVKAGAVSKELRQFYKEVIVHTGQHYDKNMSDIFFGELNIPLPDYNLDIGSASHANQTAQIMQAFEPILEKEKPDYVLVYGDTNSTLAAALTASKMNIKIIHIEAGLRSFNMSMPEEINRILTDRVSEILFVPTKTAKENLKKEGIKKGVYIVGDVMCDAVKQNIKTAKEKSKILEKYNLKKKEYMFLTLHRQELISVNSEQLTVNSDGDGGVRRGEFLRGLFGVLGDCSKKIIFPVHPRTKKFLNETGYIDIIKKYGNIKIIDPVGYIDCLWFISNAEKIITDSGGMQKEAYILGVPCITVREETEWVETVKAGWNYVTGYNKNKFEYAVNNFSPKTKRPSFYGTGKAGEKIAQILGQIC